MAFNLTARAEAATRQTSQQPQLIFEIEGVPVIFANQPVLEALRWDKGYKWDTGLRWDSAVVKPDSRDYIKLSGTTNNYSQQLNVDRAGGTGSIGSINASLVDKNSEVSKLLSFNAIDEILGKKCTVYLSYANTRFPDDAIELIRGGFVNQYSSFNGEVNISVTHPENLKRSTIFKKYTAQLTAPIDDIQTTITVNSTQNFIPSADILTSYIQIEDEIMEVVSIDSNTQFSVVRSRLNTIAAPADNESDINSLYRLQGNPLDIALRLQLSTENNDFFTSDYKIKNFDNNVITFENYNIKRVTGLIQNDTIRITGSISNDGDYTVNDFGLNTDGSSFIIINEQLNNEVGDGAVFSYKSQFNTIPTAGASVGMLPDQVDCDTYVDVRETYSTNFYDYDYIITDTIKDTKSFIDTELFFPQALYSIPRRAASSVKFTAPPLSTENLPVLNTDTIINMDKLKPVRSSSKYYYNEVIYNFNYDVLQDKNLDTFISISNESKARIKAGDKSLIIDSRGTERSTDNLLQLELSSTRLLNRYRFAATAFKGVELLYRNGYFLECGDTILLGGSDTKIVDFKTGLRTGETKAYEIINKSINIKTGKVSLDLLETSFGLTGKFAVFSPSSTIAAGSTTTSLILDKVFDNFDDGIQRDKYANLIGAKIRIHSEDYDYDEITTLESFSLQNQSAIIVSELPSAPQQGYFLELAPYENQDSDISEQVKLQYSFTMSQSEITSVTDESTFEVLDASAFAPDMLINVHSDDYNRDSVELEIDSISTNQITLKEPLSFTPVIGDKIEALGFSDSLDGGYRFV